MQQSRTVTTPAYITPVVCMHCKGMAHLMRRTMDPKRPGAEIRTFECTSCNKQVEIAAG